LIQMNNGRLQRNVGVSSEECRCEFRDSSTKTPDSIDL
jgi:hypothetical protein